MTKKKYDRLSRGLAKDRSKTARGRITLEGKYRGKWREIITVVAHVSDR